MLSALFFKKTRLFLTGISIGIIYWIFDSVIDAYVFHSGDLFSMMFSPGMEEIWNRILVIVFVLIIGAVYATIGTINFKREIKRLKTAEETLRQSEEKFRLLIENIKEVFWITAPDFKEVHYISPSYEKVWGKSLESLFKAPISWIEPIHAEDRQRVIKEIESFIPNSEFLSEFRIVRPDGTISWVKCHGFPVRNSAGEVYRMVGIAEDITEKRRMEEELGTVQKLESLGILAGGIAHDFNNILTGILGNISLAMSWIDPSDRAFIRLTEAEKASLRATELSNQLLTFARGGAPIKKVISIKNVIEYSVQFALTGSNVQSQLFFQEDLWSIEADEGQMNQVIQNIIINADQAMPAGGTIRIEAKNLTKGENGDQGVSLRKGDYIIISIQDQGMGISKENLSKIFDPYFTTKEKGSGLGLSITYSIIQRHYGYITVESNLGTGTTFFIYLPASSHASPRPEAKRVEALTPGQGRILVMDDEESVLNIAGEVFKSLGYEVNLAGCGTDAVQIYKMARDSGSPFDVVITDLTVPGDFGGVETLRKLREIDPQVKVIVSSGYSNDPAMANFKSFGFSDCLSKPYRAFEVSETVKRVLKTRR